MTEKTITIPGIFGGEKNINLKDYQQRWQGHPQEIWAFLLDHGTKEERDLGKKLVEIFPQVVEKAFNKFYEKDKQQAASNKPQATSRKRLKKDTIKK